MNNSSRFRERPRAVMLLRAEARAGRAGSPLAGLMKRRELLRNLHENYEITFRFADEIVFAEKPGTLQSMLQQLDGESRKADLCMNLTMLTNDECRKGKYRLVDNFKNKEKDKGQGCTKNIRKLKWNWTGHIMRTNKEKWTKDVVEWYPRNGKRKRGGQIKRWEDDLPKGWRRSTRDGEKWKKLGEAYVDRQPD
ncbi:hypothetical protein EVAR_4672_1 [Eumeta japonica]|uniref:Reverse transcriptase domain-containing protein n=1 Tax=Eumeta variegata TaxID=151549 RepID=A0A4C1YA10_EUMVA|nr:hypothetical protein EVAR_4672_1 [Eumeta japonica]